MLHGAVAAPADAKWILIQDGRVGVRTGTAATIIVKENPATVCPVQRTAYLSHRGNIPQYAAGIPEGADCPSMPEFAGVRDLFMRIPEEELAIAGLTAQLIDYDRTTQFCGRCGEHTHPLRSERRSAPRAGLSPTPASRRQ